MYLTEIEQEIIERWPAAGRARPGSMMYLTEIEQEIIERLIKKVTELAETAILALESGEDEFVWALASHTLSPLDREVMVWIRDRLQEAR